MRQYCAVILTLCVTEKVVIKEDPTFVAWTDMLKPIITQQSFESKQFFFLLNVFSTVPISRNSFVTWYVLLLH